MVLGQGQNHGLPQPCHRCATKRMHSNVWPVVDLEPSSRQRFRTVRSRQHQIENASRRRHSELFAFDADVLRRLAAHRRVFGANSRPDAVEPVLVNVERNDHLRIRRSTRQTPPMTANLCHLARGDSCTGRDVQPRRDTASFNLDATDIDRALVEDARATTCCQAGKVHCRSA